MSQNVSSNTVSLPSKSVVTMVYGAVFSALFVLYLILNFFWGDRIPMTFSQLVGTTQVFPGIAKVWFIFAWAAVITLGLALIRGLWGGTMYIDSRDTFFVRGWWLSLNAGVFEELIYRWLVFFCAMLLLQVLNFLTNGLVWQLNVSLFIPLINWETLGALAPQLLHSGNWVIGAGISVAAGRFQTDHKYQGWFGSVNAWFIGMILFYVMFHYGIITAMVAHFLYDAIVFTITGLILKERPFGERLVRELLTSARHAATSPTRRSVRPSGTYPRPAPRRRP